MRYLILLFGVFCCSTAVIWIKLTTVDPTLLAACRLLGASLFLSPLFFRARSQHAGAFTRQHLKRCLLPGALLALHFITWIIGARLTWAANSTLVVNVIPVVMPFLMYLSVGERITRGELIGTLVAISGVFVLGWESYRLDKDLLVGDAICAASMMLFAVYLTFSRKNKDFVNLWLYVVPVYAVGGIVCLLALPFTGSLSEPIPTRQWLFVLGLTLVPTVLGHSLLNWGMQRLRGQLVAILNLAQFMSAGILGAIILKEVPGTLFVLAASLVVAGAVTAILTQPKSKG